MRNRNPAPRLLALLLLGGVIACTSSLGPGATSAPPAQPTLTSTDAGSTPTLSPSADTPATAVVSTAPTMATAEPTGTPLPELPADLVWFAPNMGSTDHVELFTNPDAWAAERDLIDIFQFHSAVLFPEPCPICGDNSITTLGEAGAFRQLAEWEIPIAVEVGAIYEGGCDGSTNFLRDAGAVINAVAARGGSVRILSMDEPLIHGGAKPVASACDFTPAEAAVETADFVRAVHASHPEILVGLTEPYPHFSVRQLQDWIIELESNGIQLPFFHIDVDVERVRVEGHNVARDLRRLRDFCAEHGITFGVIFTSNWTQAGNNRAYYRSTMDWVDTVKRAIGRPQHVKFESWQGPAPSGHHEIPVNLDHNDPRGFGHMRLLRDGLEALGPP